MFKPNFDIIDIFINNTNNCINNNYINNWFE